MLSFINTMLFNQLLGLFDFGKMNKLTLRDKMQFNVVGLWVKTA
jgi:hypothetical protein